jgi:hypothetical protein
MGVAGTSDAVGRGLPGSCHQDYWLTRVLPYPKVKGLARDAGGIKNLKMVVDALAE